MNAGELSRRMAGDAATIAEHLLPGGKRKSGEWKAGSVSGDEGQSLSVRLSGSKAGVWKDFATGESGDLLDLWMAARGLSIAEAMAEAKAFLNIRDDVLKAPQRQYTRPSKPRCQSPKMGVKEWLNGRGITDETITAFKIGEQLRGGKTYAVFPYLRDGELVNAKYRNVAEKRDMRQEGGAEPCLFGWHLIDPKLRTVAICEGEIDCLTLHQVGIPALSANAGAGNHQWIESDWDRLQRFSEILLFYDADDAGQKGAREVAQRLGEDRCKVVTLPAKDANEYLQQGADGSDFWECTRHAKPFDPEELRSAADFMDQVKAMFYPPADKARPPVLRLDRDFDWFEFRYGELTVWTGRNGHGKSLMLSQVLAGLMSQGERCVVFSGEMMPGRLLKRAAKQLTGADRPTRDYLDAVTDWLRGRMWIFNVVGSAELSRLLAVFSYAVKRYDVRHFVIDSLMMTDVPEDGAGAMTKQKEAIQKMADFAKRNNCHLHLVAHPRKGLRDADVPDKSDVAGSSKITDGADNVFTVWSASKDESESVVDADKPDGKLELRKQRNGDVQHYTQWLWFNRDAMQFTSDSHRRPVRFVDFECASVVPEAF